MVRRLTCLAVLLILVVSACGDDDGAGGVVVVDAGDAGTQVMVALDGRLDVRLEGNPTTGYDWEVDRPGVLELVDRHHEPDSDAAGSGGLSTLVFEPTMLGSGDLVLVYHRSWEEDEEPLETFRITVSVIE
jgi:inhibitor of cysteine peptidase